MENHEHSNDHKHEEKTKHEKDKERRAHKEAERHHTSTQAHTKSSSKKIITYLAAALLIIGVGYGLFSFFGDSSPAGNSTNVDIPNYPIHWHPHLRIFINGEQQVVPANVGLTATFHAPIHTHATDGLLHMENIQPTRETMILGYFFKVWDKRLSSTCLFEFCNEGENVVRVFVDGKLITDPENLVMRDKQGILILYGPLSEDATKYFENYRPPEAQDIRM